jgi:hypothetical protein
LKRFDVILLFCVFSISSTVLFQNCSEMEANRALSSNNSSSEMGPAPLGPLPDPPEFLTNREIIFDNKRVENANLSTSWEIESDVFYYETDYNSVYSSTLLTIRGNGQFAVVTAEGDNCMGELILTDEQDTILSGLMFDGIGMTQILRRNLDDPEVIPGCAFPRLGMDTGRLLDDGTTPAVDFDIYLSPADCTPANEFYTTDINGNDPQAFLNRAQAFFHPMIDQLCQ